MSLWALLRRLLARLLGVRRSAPKAPPAPHTVHRPFTVYVARNRAEWTAFPFSNKGNNAAVYCPDDGRYPDAPLVAFNHDAWPSACSTPGTYPLGVVLSAARAQDLSEGRPERLLIEDFILHEVAGHHLMGIGADHDSTNTLMNERNGPKTEADRQALRNILAETFDGFTVHLGTPGQK